MRRKALLLVLLLPAIFPALASAAFDHTHSRWTLVLQQVVQDGRIDYVQLVRDPTGIEQYVKELGKIGKKEFEAFSSNEKIAYWLNLYNAQTVLAITRNYPVVPKDPNPLYPKNSIRQIPGIWTKMRFRTALGMATLNMIEAQYIKGFRDPRLMFLMVNGTRSGPKIMDQAVHPERIEAQMNEAVRNFVLDAGNVRADPNTKTMFLSKVFQWKGKQFVPMFYKTGHFRHRTKTEIAILAFLNEYGGMMEKMMILRDDFVIRYLEYDWSLNER